MQSLIVSHDITDKLSMEHSDDIATHLICESAFSLIRFSFSRSLEDEGSEGYLDTASAPEFSFPAMWTTLKEYLKVFYLRMRSLGL